MKVLVKRNTNLISSDVMYQCVRVGEWNTFDTESTRRTVAESSNWPSKCYYTFYSSNFNAHKTKYMIMSRDQNAKSQYED